MANQTQRAGKKEKKGVAWYIPAPLRHWLNSHAEYLSAIGKQEISTDAMVVEWLKEKVKIEEAKRDPRALERALEKRDQNENSLNSNHEDGQGAVRLSFAQDDKHTTPEDIRNAIRGAKRA